MTTLATLLIILAVVLALTGVVGAIVPALPGPPLALAGLLTVYFTLPGTVSGQLVLVMLVLTVFVTLLDYVAPTLLTKMGGGSRGAVWGTTFGMVVGLFFLPAGLLWGPFFGALIGELVIAGSPVGKSLRVAALSFISFLLTTGMKLILSVVMTYYTIAAPLGKVL